ncbi:MAG: DEAD/DEAH box helicase [Acidimicrobiaceae bacterium]|nr:DEAD/DEAH box helicase [Acidimicrobiaceae bacterium]MCY4295059.1 DEAD/DEAH box helicase [Acidimicrobiaceae bacterium]
MNSPAGAGFILDEFQRLAVEHLDAGRSVLVAAPTGSGKTVVAEHAVDMALATGRRAFYTTPVKALSNQKYRDLRERLGESRVGLLTGDNVIAADADVVVMTTEVLRNMLYAAGRADASGPDAAGSSGDSGSDAGDAGGAGDAVSRLGVVVLDEVHYLEDPYRGPVWEEVILLLPASVVLVCLSATVSNHRQLGDWLNQARGPTAVVSESRRPVPLNNLYAVGRRRSSEVRILPTLVDGESNPQGKRFDAPPRPARQRFHRGGAGAAGGAPRRRGESGGTAGGSRRLDGRGPRPGDAAGRQGAGSRSARHRRGPPASVWRPPRRVDLLAELRRRRLLPVIWFVFSRKGCDTAAARLERDGACFNDEAEADRIDEIVARRLERLDPSDLAVLGVRRWREQLRLGIAAHHAGMVPVLKEAVEQCFSEGLVKVVFATETLALGVNMPARSVVIDKPFKFDGQRTVALSAAQHTQFTGRAGRRGIDDEGWAVDLWSPECSFSEVAERAASRAFELRSAFRPTYNMVAALLSRSSAEAARHLMSRSFAQFQADRQFQADHQGPQPRRSDRSAKPSEPHGRSKPPQRRGAERQRQTPDARTDLSGRFDAVAAVLRDRGHLHDWDLSDSGLLVSRIFHEADLVVAEALSTGLFVGLSPPELASVLSAFSYEHRSPKPPPDVWIPSGAAHRRLRRIEALVAELHRTERRFGLEPIRSLDTGFASAAHRWAAGESFEALQDEGFSAGDFVRNVKQVIDLARQLAAVAPDAGISESAAAVARSLNRGVVALSGAV